MDDSVTRRDAAGASQSPQDMASTVPPTLRDTVSPSQVDRLSRTLPSALSSRFRVVEEFPAAGSEADVLLVESVAEGTRYVAKLYRLGIAPKTDVLDEVARSISDHVAQLLEYGQSDGRWFELMEYAAHGSLRSLIEREGPRLNQEIVREVLRELAEALAHLHAHRIVHRDLKPDNVLIRRREPLDLVLTDFGISSLVEGSLRFTEHANRTIRYAAPEAWAGAVSPALDYWALGIMLVEMLTGRHPFAGISDMVVQRHVSTMPVPLEGIDGEWALLGRGLLTRDDKKRWGKAEIDRWMAGDRTLTVTSAEDVAQQRYPPYAFGGEMYRDPPALARALARRWDDGERELARGYIRRWVYEDIRDLDLARFLDDMDEDRSLGIEAKLFRVVTRFDPNLPPSYKGYALTEASLRDLAVVAVQGNERAQQVLSAIYAERLLTTYTNLTGTPEGAGLEQRWRAAAEEYGQLRARAAEAEAGSEATLGQDLFRAHLLLGITSVEYGTNLRREVTAAASRIGMDCPWFKALGRPLSASPAALLAMSVAAPFAERSAKEGRAARVQAIAKQVRNTPLRTEAAFLFFSPVIVVGLVWYITRRGAFVEPLLQAESFLEAGFLTLLVVLIAMGSTYLIKRPFSWGRFLGLPAVIVFASYLILQTTYKAAYSDAFYDDEIADAFLTALSLTFALLVIHSVAGRLTLAHSIRRMARSGLTTGGRIRALGGCLLWPLISLAGLVSLIGYIPTLPRDTSGTWQGQIADKASTLFLTQRGPYTIAGTLFYDGLKVSLQGSFPYKRWLKLTGISTIDLVASRGAPIESLEGKLSLSQTKIEGGYRDTNNRQTYWMVTKSTGHRLKIERIATASDVKGYNSLTSKYLFHRGDQLFVYFHLLQLKPVAGVISLDVEYRIVAPDRKLVLRTQAPAVLKGSTGTGIYHWKVFKLEREWALGGYEVEITVVDQLSMATGEASTSFQVQ